MNDEKRLENRVIMLKLNASFFIEFQKRRFRAAAGILLMIALIYGAACSDSDSDARWEFEDSFPEIVPGACDELLEASEGRPSVEQVDEDTWALHFEPFEQDCAVYQTSMLFEPSSALQAGARYRQYASICNRCSEPQAFDSVSDVRFVDDAPDSVVVENDPDGPPGKFPGPLISFGRETESGLAAVCHHNLPAKEGNEPRRSRFISSLKLGRFPLQTGVVLSIPSLGGALNDYVFDEPGPTLVEFSSEFYMRALWPRLVPIDAPADATVTAFQPFICEALGWETEPGAEIIMPGEYRPEEAYWEAPVQRFELPEALLEWLEH